MNFEESVEINLFFLSLFIARLCLWAIADQKTPLEEGTILPLIGKWTKENPCSRISLKTAWKETKKTVDVDCLFMFKPKGSALSCHQPEYPYSESTSILIPFQGFKLCRHPREYKVCFCCFWAHLDWGCYLALACIFNYIWSKFMHLRVQSVSWLVDSVCHPSKLRVTPMSCLWV